MFIKSGIKVILTSFDSLLIMSKNVSKQIGKSRLSVALDSLYCLFVYGTIFTEYQAFDFVNRSKANRKTFVTVLWLLEQLKKYNPELYRSNFHDKCVFNSLFKDYIRRDFVDLSLATEEDVESFFDKHKSIVLKQSRGCSGKQVHVVTVDETKEDVLNLIRSEGYNLIEEKITNCDEIKSLNPTSLNTIRVVTISSGEYFKVVCACLRIGGLGSHVDNVSMGGGSAKIDLSTGCISTVFCTNAYRERENSPKGRNEIGFKIPYWEETLQVLKKASQLVPEIHVVGWDVAVTPNGPVIIEGNESFHTDVMQFYASSTEPGIKQDFQKALSHINN